MGRIPLLAALGAVFALISLPAAADIRAPGAMDARTKAKRCARGQVMAVVKGRTLRVVSKAPRKGGVLCLRRPAPPKTAAQARAGARRLLEHPSLRPPYLNQLERNRDLRRLRPFERRLESIVSGGAPVGARASRETQTQSQDIADQAFGGKDVPGASAEARTTSEAPDAGEVGGHTEMEGEMAIERGGARVAKRSTFGQGGFADRCPGADGIVEGVVKFKLGDGLSVKEPGRKKAASADFAMTFETKFRARVGDDGRWKDFSYTGAGAAEVKGFGLDGRYLSRVYRVAYSFGPVARDEKVDASTFARMFQRFVGRGPRGDKLDDREISLLLSLGGLAGVITLDETKSLLNKAEQHWYDREGCLRVEFDPASLQVEPGQTVPVGVAVRPTEGGGPDAGAQLEVSGSNGATVTPASARSPADVSFTAPGTRWDSSTAPSMSVQATSRQGRASGTLAAEPLELAFRVVFEGTTSLDDHRFSRSCGAEGCREHRRDEAQRGSFRLVWPEVRFDPGGPDVNVTNNCPGCNSGALDFASSFTSTSTEPGPPLGDTSGSCAETSTTPNGDSNGPSEIRIRQDLGPAEPAPLVPSVGFAGFSPGLEWVIRCEGNQSGAIDVEQTLDEHYDSFHDCTPDPGETFIDPAFYVARETLRSQSSFEQPVGASYSADCRDTNADESTGTLQFSWTGRITFTKLAP